MFVNPFSSYLGIHLSETLLLMRKYLTQQFEKKLPTLRFEDWMQLMPVVLSAGITQKVLSEQLVRDKTTISRLVDNWEEKGWVKRKISSEDKRSYGIFMTKKGTENWEKGVPIVIEADQIFKKQLTNEDEKTLYFLSFKIRTAIENYISS
ncbi:MAG: MarR family transcriptional regulator [Leptospira sp.]|nr:MarR family transcriptional regulator [Leptospira sp.]